PEPEPEPEIQRESMDVDVLFVGAGVASLAGAIRLMQCIQAHNEKGEGDPIQEPTIAIVEKGSEVGAHILSGAVMNPVALDELLPGWRDEAPIEAEVTDEDVTYLTATKSLNLPVIPPPMHNKGNLIVSASRIARWMAEKAESMGVMIFPGFPAVDVLWEGDQVVGVQTGDKGIDAHGKRKANFEPGILLKAKMTIFGEGVLGHCSRLVTRKLGLDEGRNPWQFETGVKEIIKLPEGKGRPGYVMHTLGWPLDSKTLGGTWVYGLADDYVSIGLVVSLDYQDPSTDPQYLLQKFKAPPRVAALIEGGTVEEYGGKALTAGGWYSMQQPWFDGGMFIGESAQIMNIAALKGMHLAMKSGMLAAETACEALASGDWSAAALKAYGDRIEGSYIKTEMWGCRNFHQSFDKGLWVGMMRTGPAMFLGSVGRKDGHHDHSALSPVAVATDGSTELSDQPKVEIPSFKQKLDDLYLSGTLHDEDQPCHLLVAEPDICKTRCTEEYGNPCTRFCPAQVYEMVPDDADGGKKLQVNFSNCVHCKTCDIKDPYQIITWVPPEGGGGP
ncbi:MAG TPA: electron transfer flavoprotein-ubiquinone oxidoreductase, partial [Deltaproteobacteria bacterium]|nr:electron transfer flavoprotein-ubiquinone oxidoreductase [Deltaproteobacteria bacterium]